MLSEKIGGAKGTEIDGQFQIMEKVLIIFKMLFQFHYKIVIK